MRTHHKLGAMGLVLAFGLFGCAQKEPSPGHKGTMGRRPQESPISRLRTKIFRVTTPTQEVAFFQVLATADGQVYLIPESQRATAELAERASKEETPVELSVEGREVLSVEAVATTETPTAPADALQAPSEGKLPPPL